MNTFTNYIEKSNEKGNNYMVFKNDKLYYHNKAKEKSRKRYSRKKKEKDYNNTL